MGSESAITKNGGDVQVTAALWATAHRFLWHLPTRTAILSDIHLGVEESLVQQGIYIPDTITPQVRERWAAVMGRKPERVIVAGDLFDQYSPSERAIALCQEMLGAVGCPVTVIPGNHDPDEETLLGLFAGLDVTVEPHALLGKVLISHGHNMTMEEASRHGCETRIVGHQHPALTLATAVQKAKMACYAVCDFPGGVPGRMILLPAFSPGPLGSNLLTRAHWLLPVERPRDDQVAILGLVEGNGRVPQVLPFGTLAMHATQGSSTAR